MTRRYVPRTYHQEHVNYASNGMPVKTDVVVVYVVVVDVAACMTVLLHTSSRLKWHFLRGFLWQCASNAKASCGLEFKPFRSATYRSFYPFCEGAIYKVCGKMQPARLQHTKAASGDHTCDMCRLSTRVTSAGVSTSIWFSR